jgi:hypothetical protein
VLWNVDPTELEPSTTAAQIAQRVIAAVKAGSIVGLHDGGGDCSATLAALPAIIRGIRARVLHLVALTPGTNPVAQTDAARPALSGSVVSFVTVVEVSAWSASKTSLWRGVFRIELSEREERELRRRARQQTRAYREVTRAKIVLLAADGGWIRPERR